MSEEVLRFLPTLNASLNAFSAILLVTGYLFIRRKRVKAHATCMVGALFVGVLFFISYGIYHYHVGATRFPGTGFWRIAYFTILISHTMLAVTVPVLAVWTVVRAIRRNFKAHARLARWTFPIWLYVSITGVLVYLMLYHLFPGGQ
jgi:uncharacterized membrane protein YozB (DUF420 family)